MPAALTSTVTFQQPTGSKETVYRWNSAAAERDVVLLTGEQPGSERETEALCQLIHQIHPAWVVSFTIRWPASKIRATARWVAGWPTPSPCRWWARGYDTPGSAAGAPISDSCITAEFRRSPPTRHGALPAGDDRSAALAGLKMKHAGAEPQRRLNVHRQPCRAVEVSEARQRRQRSAAAIRARCRAYSPASVQILPFRLPARASASVRPPVYPV